MQDQEKDIVNFDDSISESIEGSIAKALLIMEEEEERKKQMLYRPKVSLARGVAFSIVYIFIMISLLILSGNISELLGISLPLTVLLIILIMLFVFLIVSKQFIIWMIRVYQKYAPAEVRVRCVFVPTCSEYMIGSINKYGVFRGVIRGIQRLKRCHAPNGGIDEP